MVVEISKTGEIVLLYYNRSERKFRLLKISKHKYFITLQSMKYSFHVYLVLNMVTTVMNLKFVVKFKNTLILRKLKVSIKIKGLKIYVKLNPNIVLNIKNELQKFTTCYLFLLLSKQLETLKNIYKGNIRH